MIKKIKEWSGVIALVAIVLALIIVSHQKKTVLGGTPQNCGGTVTCFTDLAVSSLFVNTTSWLGGSTDATSRQEVVSTGTCTAATSTLFAVANPMGATSTARLILLTGTGQATSTSIDVSTSTTATGLIYSSVGNAGLVSSSTVATSSQFSIVGGVLTGSLGQVSANVLSVRELEVAPTDYIGAFATSTYAASNNTYTPGLTTCSYKVLWTR